MKRAKRTMDELRPSVAKNETFVETSNMGEVVLSEKNKTAKKSMFWRIYAIVFASLSILVLAAILVVNSALTDYESARPGYVADEVFQSYFMEGDAEKLMEMAGFELSPVEGSADFERFWDEQTKGELSCVRVSADNGSETVRYNVRSGEKTFAAFELSLNGEKTGWGNPLYELSEIELGVGAKFNARISAPNGAKVVLNGVELGDDCIVEHDIETESCAHMPEGVKGITYDTYEVKGMLFEPQVSVLTSDGKEHPLTFNEATKTHKAELLYDAELKAEMEDYVIEAAQTYAASMQNDRPKSAALAYIEYGTKLYSQTAVVDTIWVSSHSGYRFEQVKADEFISYDENTFSCRVSFVHVLTGGTTKFDEKGENRENVDITWYFRKVGNQYLIYDRENS